MIKYRLVYKDGTEKILDDFEEAYREALRSEGTGNEVILFENVIE